MKITRRTEQTPIGEVTLFRMENPSGSWAEVSSLGAGITGVGVPDREGRIENVALSYGSAADYVADGPCLGKCPGRYANRIAGGHLEVDGRTYQLAINNGPNHLHGGPDGFQNRIWDVEELPDGVKFTRRSPDGEENYPGNLTISVTYRWSDDDTLSIRFEAESDADTVINMTNHAYWNLGGVESGTALGHELRMHASRWLPTDDTLIPLGTLDPVAGTPMDFTEWKQLGRDIKEDFPALKYGKGYDNCWAIDAWEPGRFDAEALQLRLSANGRMLTVGSDQPGVQVYTGNWLAGSPRGKEGREFQDYDGVAIEMQGFPDAPNKPQFPSQLLKKGEKYVKNIAYHFSVF